MRVIEDRELQANCQALLNEHCQTWMLNKTECPPCENRLCYSRNNDFTVLQERCQKILFYSRLSVRGLFGLPIIRTRS